MIFSNSLSHPLRLAYRVILLIFRVYFEKTDLNIKSNSFCCAAKSCLSTRQSINNFSKEGTQILSIFTMGDSVISFFTMITSSRRNRWTAFLNLDETKGSFGYQVWQSILSISNGGVSGVGVGAGTGKWGYVPLAHSDFIFSTIAEEMGLIGAAVVIGGFLTLVVFGLRAALHAEERFGALLAGGVTMWFAIQAIINIGGVTGSMPVTGLTLPLISYGGSSLLVCMSAAGLLMNVARNMK